MLKNLLKYDLKSVLKVIVVFYILGLFFAILTRILFIFDDNSTILNIIGKVTQGITISMLASAIINNFMRVWLRFKNNLYGDESYLTHTLPVSKKKIYLSKVLTSIITMFLTIIVLLAALFIMFYSKANMEALKGVLQFLATSYNSTVFGFIFILAIILFLELLLALLIGNFGLILGHKNNNNKMIMSIVFGFIAYMVTQTFIFVVIFIIGLINPSIMELFTSNTVDINVVKQVLYIALFVYLACNIFYYFMGSKLLGKGVNVD